jgi:hypothetical protein
VERNDKKIKQLTNKSRVRQLLRDYKVKENSRKSASREAVSVIRASLTAVSDFNVTLLNTFGLAQNLF